MICGFFFSPKGSPNIKQNRSKLLTIKMIQNTTGRKPGQGFEDLAYGELISFRIQARAKVQ